MASEKEIDDRGRVPECCPICGGGIEQGSVSVHATALGFLFAGFSYQHFWFKGRAKKEQVVVGSGQRSTGFRCVKCGFVGIYKATPPLFESPW